MALLMPLKEACIPRINVGFCSKSTVRVRVVYIYLSLSVVRHVLYYQGQTHVPNTTEPFFQIASSS